MIPVAQCVTASKGRLKPFRSQARGLIRGFQKIRGPFFGGRDRIICIYKVDTYVVETPIHQTTGPMRRDLKAQTPHVDPKPRDIAREAVDGATWRYNATTVLVFAWKVLWTWSAGFNWTLQELGRSRRLSKCPSKP